MTRVSTACWLALLPLAISLASTPAALAAGFQLGDVQGQFDSELSIGVNFSTLVAGATLAGEVSYRPNYNLQINSSDLSLTALPGALLGGFDYGAISPVYNSQNVGMQPGDEITGWPSAWA